MIVRDVLMHDPTEEETDQDLNSCKSRHDRSPIGVDVVFIVTVRLGRVADETVNHDEDRSEDDEVTEIEPDEFLRETRVRNCSRQEWLRTTSQSSLALALSPA